MGNYITGVDSSVDVVMSADTSRGRCRQLLKLLCRYKAVRKIHVHKALTNYRKVCLVTIVRWQFRKYVYVFHSWSILPPDGQRGNVEYIVSLGASGPTSFD